MRKIFLVLFLIPLFLQAQVNLSKPDYKLLLVKLKTHKTQINSLRDSGFVKTASRKEEHLKIKNIELKNAFKQFTHCPVYFFYSHDTDSLLKAQNKTLFLFDSLYHPIKDSLHIQQINNQKFIIGELGYLSDNQMGVPSFYLSNAQNIPLQKPFPYYVRSHFFGVPSSFEYMIRKLQIKLHKK